MVAKRGLKGLKGLKDLRLSPGVERMDTGQVVHYTDQRDTTKGTATPQRKRRKKHCNFGQFWCCRFTMMQSGIR